MALEKTEIGKTGEKVAANFLKNKGYEILAMNFKNNSGIRMGEIDIIARDLKLGEIVFVEVKTRDYVRYGNTLPEENIGYEKLRKIAKTSSFYLKKYNLENVSYRFDAVSVWLNYQTRMAKIKHISNIYLN